MCLIKLYYKMTKIKSLLKIWSKNGTCVGYAFVCQQKANTRTRLDLGMLTSLSIKYMYCRYILRMYSTKWL